MKKLSESIWSDIQDRSSGEVTRKEDEFNPEYIDFGENTTVYWMTENLIIDNASRFLFDNIKDYNNNGWRLPTVEEVKQLNWDGTRIIWSGRKNIFRFPDGNEITLNFCNETPGARLWTKDVYDKSSTAIWGYGLDMANKFTLDPFNRRFNKLLVVLVKDKKPVNESIWSDIQDRSSGDVIRNEDKFNPDYVDFGDNTTVYWAIDNLDINGEVKFYFDDVKDYNNNGWRLPTVDEVNQLKWNIRITWYEGYNHLKFDDGNELRIKTNSAGGGFHMWTKEINTKFPSGAYAYGFDNSNDFDITSFNKSINRLFVFLVKDKKITESIWSDIQDRSSGETIRKEDEITNIKDLVPVDMGGSVLWADDDLSLKDGDCYFAFDEVFELIKNSGWRLPTLEEVAELDKIYEKGSFWGNEDRFVFDGYPHQLVFFKKGLIYTTAGDEPTDEDYYYCWTSTLLKTNNRFVHILTFDNDHPIHTPVNYNNINDTVVQDTNTGKLCVRLVKDK